MEHLTVAEFNAPVQYADNSFAHSESEHPLARPVTAEEDFQAPAVIEQPEAWSNGLADRSMPYLNAQFDARHVALLHDRYLRSHAPRTCENNDRTLMSVSWPVSRSRIYLLNHTLAFPNDQI